MHAHQNRRGLVTRGGFDGDARPQTREGIRARARRRAASRSAPADGDGAEELEPLRRGDGFPSTGHVQTPFFEKRDQRRQHFERREVHVLDHHPHALRHRLGQRARLPFELAGRRADDVRAEERFRIRLRVEVKRDEIGVSGGARHLLERRALPAPRGTLEEKRTTLAQRQRRRLEVTSSAPRLDHRAETARGGGRRGGRRVAAFATAQFHAADANVPGSRGEIPPGQRLVVVVVVFGPSGSGI